ncbi:DDE-type integrase/transposase/recombinase [Corynebacterium cystitidis]|uniref:DDE-type integrase/transposase/recombinase n=1 Tax=Corynebacterium cystitidis TaxID=35757 RepID=UPI00211E409A|nr:DDE-type integrase/transposase/recombinase [Corynebacterium cystitidis]
MDNPTPHTERNSVIAYSEKQRDEIAQRINADPTKSVRQICHEAWDAGQAMASESTYYRIARSHRCPTRGHQRRETSPEQAHRPAASAPQLHATRPWQVIVWDITLLPLLQRGRSLAAHVAMDLYSRAIVGVGLSAGPNTDTATEIFTTILADAGCAGLTVETVHADNGKTMKSRKLTTLFATHNIKRSHSRPHTSDDNPHIESVFSTIKQDPIYPHVFTDTDEAATWLANWVNFYNTQRMHSAIANFTPQSVLDGSWRGQWAIRKANKLEHYNRNPARYRYRPPVVATPPKEVRFNLTNTPDDITNQTPFDQLAHH